MADLTDREVLEEQRAFLFRSLDDLDAEHAEGNIDDASFARLRADYTARCAQVLNRLDGAEDAHSDERDEISAGAPTGMRRRVVVGLAVVAFAAVVSIALANGLGARLPGETITGNQGSDSQSANPAAGSQADQLRAAIKARPDDASLRLALARLLMGRANYPGALIQFQAASRIAPTNPEPFAYSGWLLRLQGFPAQGLTLLDRALTVSPEYPDARFFKGVILLRDRSDPDAAIAEFRQYLVAAPDSPLANQVRTLLAEAVGAQRTLVPRTTASSSPPTNSSP